MVKALIHRRQKKMVGWQNAWDQLWFTKAAYCQKPISELLSFGGKMKELSCFYLLSYVVLACNRSFKLYMFILLRIWALFPVPWLPHIYIHYRMSISLKACSIPTVHLGYVSIWALPSLSQPLSLPLPPSFDLQLKWTASCGLLTARLTRPYLCRAVSTAFLIQWSCWAGKHQANTFDLTQNRLLCILAPLKQYHKGHAVLFHNVATKSAFPFILHSHGMCTEYPELLKKLRKD